MRSFLYYVIVLVAFGFLASGCAGSDTSKVDIQPFFGKTRPELIQMLGEPTGPDRAPSGMTADPDKLIYVKELQTESPRLPAPLERLVLDISGKGYCYAVSGQTMGLESPEAMLDALGVGSLPRERTKKVKLGCDYRMPPYETVEIRRQWDKDPAYTRFHFDDRDAVDGSSG